MPKSTLLLSVSRRYAAISPKSASSGAWGTTLASKAVAAIGAICVEIWERRRLEEEEEEEEAAGEGEVRDCLGESGMTAPLYTLLCLLYVSRA
jgi:hypothetical protein